MLKYFYVMNHKYNGRIYKIHQVVRGGRSIKVKGEKYYLKNQRRGLTNFDILKTIFIRDGVLNTTDISENDWNTINMVIRTDSDWYGYIITRDMDLERLEQSDSHIIMQRHYDNGNP